MDATDSVGLLQTSRLFYVEVRSGAGLRWELGVGVKGSSAYEELRLSAVSMMRRKRKGI